MQRKLIYRAFLIGFLLFSFCVSEASNCAFSIVSSAVDVSCNGGTNGSATVDPQGNNSNYTYLWNDPNAQTTFTASNLNAGTYQVHIKDLSNCDTLVSITVKEPTALNGSVTTTDASCNALCDGTALATVSGGSLPYTYQWDDPSFQKNALAVNLCAGTFSVMVKDANGCTAKKTITINEPAKLNVTATDASLTCYGTCNASVTASASGGTQPYVYLWNDPLLQSSANATNLCAGNFIITVTDKNGCKTTDTSLVSQPAELIGTITATNPLCFGDCNGTTKISATGGTGTYSYVWNTGSKSTSLSKLCDGTYSVIVTDKSGCKDTSVVLLAAPPKIVASATSDIVDCNSSTGNIAVASVNGGLAPYSYQWSTSPIQTNDTASNLSAGTYIIVIKDANGCQTSATTTINNSTPVFIPAPVVVQPTCQANSGEITCNAYGGQGALTYSWSNTSLVNTNSMTGLAPGTYTITVSDTNSCTSSATVVLTNSFNQVFLDTLFVKNVSCNGGNDGSSTALASAGSAPYNYTWNTNPIQTTASVTNLKAGNYFVYVKDVNGCTDTVNFSVGQPSALVLTSSVVIPTCKGNCNGSASINVSGGTAPYTYSWNTSPIQTTSTATTICAGTYTATVTDAKGCVSFLSVTVGEPAALSISFNSTGVSCNGKSDGQSTATVNGGTAPYTYSWNTIPVQTTATAINLASGSYSLTVTDANGCSTTSSVTISQPNVLTATITATNPLCFGSCIGTATASTTGGTSPYTYSWNTVPIQTTSSALNLCAGSYTVSITDVNGCSTTANKTITEPSSLTIATSTVNPSCGNNDGQATVVANGGTSPYLYSWTGNSTQSTATAKNLSSGTYYITVFDANGCSTSDTVILNNSNPLVFSTSSTGETCKFKDGSATINVSGGSGSYQYSWNTSPIQTTATATGLTAGNYTVVVMDKNSGACKDSISVSVATPPSITISFTSTSPSCNGNNNGTITANLTGGSTPYTYSWATTPIQTTQTASGLVAGNYTVSVSDINGCIASASGTLSQPSVLKASITSSNISCFGSNSGSATASGTGGTLPYSYLWSNGASTSSATNLTAGLYSVIITDANGCSANASVTITEPKAIAVSASSSNPKCYGACDGTASVTVSGGTSPYTYSWNTTPVKTTASVTSLCDGSYTAVVSDAKGCTTQASVVLTEPTEIKLKVDTTVADCGMDNGKEYVKATGGTAPYSFSWSTPIVQTGDSAVNIKPGVYAVTATDANGCKQSQAFIISTMTPFYITVKKQNVTKCDTANGKIEITVDSGGTAPYEFLWDKGDTTNMIDHLAKGTYTVTISDSNGCDTTAVIQVTLPPVIKLSGTSIDASCGNSDGQATVIATGGTGPLTYEWTDSVSFTDIANNLPAGSYNVHVSDTIHCATDTVFVINQPPLVNVAIIGKDISCGLNNGEAYAAVTGGSGTHTILWSNGSVDSVITNLSPGNYSVSIQDSNGCSTADTITISGTQSLLVIPTVKDANCGASDGAIYLKVSGGSGVYTYSWQNNVSTNDSLQNLGKGQYIVSVLDSIGCSAIDTIDMQEANPITLSLKSVDINCNGNNNGKAIATVTGGTGKYIYSWSNGMTSADSITNLIPGTYYLTVTDLTNANCFALDTAIITTPPALLLSTNYQDITCYGNNNGKIKITASGGIGQYTYVWNNTSSAVDSAINLSAGTYSAGVKDSNGCLAIDTILIKEPDSLTLSLLVKDIICGGASDGEIHSTVTGGSFPYVYTWNTIPVQNTTFALNLGPGVYTLNVQDKNGCIVKDSGTITQPDTVKLSSHLIFGSCKGINDHAVYTKATGGSGVYSYSWNTIPQQITDTAFALSGGTYVVTVTDSTGCSAIDTVIVPTLLTITNTTHTDITCFGMNNGAIYVFTTGGSGAGTYTYNWNFSALNNDTAINLIPGKYIVSVVDTNGCVDGDTVQIIEPTLLTITTDSIDASCGTSNGEVNTKVNGGTVPYSYLWNNGATIANVTAIPKGIYWVDVTDANGCKISDTTSVHEANPLVLTMSHTDVLCNGANNGTATVATVGGSGAYTYVWSNGNTSSTIKNLAPGTYFVTATDITSNLCNAMDSVIIAQPTPLVVTGTANNTCMGMNDGAATMFVSGGTQPYTYLWNNGGTTSTITNLVAANYVGVVTDSNKCAASVTVSVNQPTTIFYLPPTINTAYCGSTNGSIYLDVFATAPLTFEWSNDSTNNTDFALNVDSGTYYIHVFDTAGCDIYDTITVTNIDYFPVVIITDSANLTCIASNNGMAVALASATNGSYTYEWNSNPIQTTDTAIGLGMGIYTVTVTDSLGCKGMDSVFIKNPDTLKNSFNAINVTCNGFNNGNVVANVVGGFAPYSYLWSTGDTINMIDSLAPGTYQITMYDSNKCVLIDSIQITEPFVLADTAIISNVKCFGGSDGKIALVISGGTQPFVYDWPITGDSLSIDSLLSIGTYPVNITDSNGCFITDTFIITEPTPLVLVIDSIASTCSVANGQALVNASGGTGLYTYVWSNGDSNSIAENIMAGNYSVVVTDSNMCSATKNISVIDIPSPIIDSIIVTNATCNSLGNASIEIVSVTGAGPFVYSWNASNYFDSIATNLSADTYLISVTDTNLCVVTQQIIIKQPDSIAISFQDSMTICYGTQATLSVTVNGGNGAYTYIWDHGLDSASTNIVNTTISMAYSVVVLDTSGCSSDTAIINVLVNPPLSIQVKADSSVCEGDPIVLNALASGGNGGPYNYNWNNGTYSGDSISVTPTATTNFVVTVSDNCGTLTVQDSAEVQVNPLPITSMFFTSTQGCSPVVVDFSFLSDIGDSLIWDFGDGSFAYDTTPQHTFTNSGLYNVTLTTISKNGCKNNAVNSAQVTVFSSPTADFMPFPDSTGITHPTISFNDNSIDAYSWTWNFGDPSTGSNDSSTDVNPTHEYSDTGTYNVQLIVINDNGCVDTIIIPVKIKDTYIVNIPNAFSPNGDGLNDIFIPVGYGTDATGYSFRIFDRWGDQIFSTSDFKQGWNGTVNGGSKKAQIDVYVWKLHVRDKSGFYHDYIGNVSLIK